MKKFLKFIMPAALAFIVLAGFNAYAVAAPKQPAAKQQVAKQQIAKQQASKQQTSKKQAAKQQAAGQQAKPAEAQKETQPKKEEKPAEKRKYKISGFIKTPAGEPVEKIAITFPKSLIKAVKTDDKGFYQTEAEEGATVNMVLEKKGCIITPASHTITNVQRDATADFTAELQKYEIRGRVAEGAVGIEGVKLTFKEGNISKQVITDKIGYFSFKDLEFGKSYELSVAKKGFTFDPDKHNIKKVSDNLTLDISAKIAPRVIKGKVIKGGEGLEGVIVKAAGKKTFTATTDANGDFIIEESMGMQKYTVTASMEGNEFVPAQIVSMPEIAQVYNFTALAKRVKLSGTVVGKNGTPVGGALITVKSGASVIKTTTNAKGYYSATLTAGGKYTIEASKAGIAFTPLSHKTGKVVAEQTANFITSAVVAPAPVSAAPVQQPVPAAKQQKAPEPAPKKTAKPVPVMPGKISLTAKVVSKKTNLPVEGIKITFMSNGIIAAETNTNKQGEAVFANATNGGSYTVAADATDYDFSKPAIALKKVGGKTKNILFEGVYKHSSVRGNAQISGAIVKLMPSSQQATTDENGKFEIKGIKAGEKYTLTISHQNVYFENDKAEFTGTAKDSVVNFKTVIGIEGVVRARAKGVSGADVLVNGKPAAKTDAQGRYLLKVEQGSDNIISIRNKEHSFYPFGIEVNNVLQNVKGQNFTAVASVSGRIVYVGGARGASGVDINVMKGKAVQASVKTDSRGNYLINNLELSGDYILKPSLRGHRLNPPSAALNNVQENILGQNFTVYTSTHTVYGTVVVGGRGVRAAEITITRRPIKYYTDGSGRYEINNLDYGEDYTVSAAIPGTNTAFAPVVISSLEKDTRADFNADLKISGAVHLDGSPIRNAAVNVNGTSYKVNEHGEYVITGLKYEGEYQLKVSAPGYTFDEDTKNFAAVTQNYTGQDFNASGKVQ